MTFLPRRVLGRTGFRATVVGSGDLADRSLGLEVCASTLRRALDAGINVVDTAPAYEDGLSEQIVGRALAGRRDGVFVIDKIDHIDRPLAEQLDASVARLGFAPDAFVFHGVSRRADWDLVVAPGGPMDRLANAVHRGRCRFRGISSHHPEVVQAALESGSCDLVLLPVGPYVDPRYLELLPMARRLGVGTVSFKTFGAGMLVGPTEGYGRPLSSPAAVASLAPPLSIAECVNATLTHNPDVALLGLSTPAEQEAAFAAVRSHVPLSPAELAEVERRAEQAIRGKGRVWWNPIESSG
jgi:aryl-alcohol dehydrogenase-like predicted oxidoreductase